MADNDRKLPYSISEKDIAEWTAFWHVQRRVLITGRLDADSLRKVSLELIKLDYAGTDPITIMVDSSGGDVVPTHQLQDFISMLNSPVDAIAMGDCASGAVDLLQMCRRRLMLPSARMLVHYVRSDQHWICDDLVQLEGDIEYFRQRMKRVTERRLALYKKRTGLTAEKIRELFRHGEVHQSFFSAEQALELHLVDEVVTDFKLFPRKPDEKKK